ncbi:hypothetical protein Tco_0553720 [Tanacetum coccineum]
MNPSVAPRVSTLDGVWHPDQYQMIEELGDPDHTPLVLPSSHLHTDDELAVEEAKQCKRDLLRVQQMMKDTNIGV